MPVFAYLQKRHLRRGSFLKQAGPPRENFAQAYVKKVEKGRAEGRATPLSLPLGAAWTLGRVVPKTLRKPRKGAG